MYLWVNFLRIFLLPFLRLYDSFPSPLISFLLLPPSVFCSVLFICPRSQSRLQTLGWTQWESWFLLLVVARLRWSVNHVQLLNPHSSGAVAPSSSPTAAGNMCHNLPHSHSVFQGKMCDYICDTISRNNFKNNPILDYIWLHHIWQQFCCSRKAQMGFTFSQFSKLKELFEIMFTVAQVMKPQL